MTRRRPSGSFLFSLALHAALAVVLANVVVHYEILFEHAPRSVPPTAESVTYVTVSPPAGATGGTGTELPARATQPSRRLVAPSRVPAAIAPTVGEPTAGGTPGGVDGGTSAGGGVGPATGIVPGEVDPRLGMGGKFFYPAPKTAAERADSAVKATILAYNDSVAMAAANQGRKPGDWTFDRNGKKYGIDGSKIYLGKFWIPSAVLAALPIRAQANPGEAAANRLVSTHRGEVLLHAQSQFQDQEFKTAVKRIRERKDRERREKERQQNDERGVAQSSNGSR
ncbi:MAG TPA: hypothetical protein VFS59_17300 [Gemmatimonadaceae bacterium]|nr:hypothetical protein [Gemmatimonadaceae bacterium]